MRYIIEIDQRIKNKLQEGDCELPAYLRFSGQFNEENTAKFCEEFIRAEDHATRTKQDILPVIIDSYGGDAYALMAMIDILDSSKIKIATICEGKAMSAGSFLLSCGAEGYRFMSPNATVMIHEVSCWAGGKNEEIKSTSQEIDRLNEKAFHILAKNCGKKKDYFLNLVHDNRHADLYLSPQECLKHNIVNHIGIPGFNVKISVEHKFLLDVNDKDR